MSESHAQSMRSGVVRYALAMLCVAAALGLALLQREIEPETLFLAAIMVATWFAGNRPGFLAAVVATLAFDYFFTPPLGTLGLRTKDVSNLVVFALSALFIAWISAARRRAETALREARDDLDAKVRERTASLAQTNERLQAEIAERTRGEQRLATQYAVTRILAESSSLAEAAPRLLRAIRERLGWDWGALWHVDRDARVLRCSDTWHAPNIDVDEFDTASRARAFAPGEGVPGHVWQTGEPAWVTDATASSDFVRASVATSVGLRGALAFPILLGGQTLGVIEFFSRAVRQPDRELLDALSAIGSQISQFIERKRVETELRERANLLDLTHDTIFVRDRNDVITYWNRGAEERYGWAREHAVGTVSHQLLHTVFPAPLEEITAELLGTDRWEGELVHTKRDGTRVVVASRWSLQRDESGDPVAVLETNNDVTERKRAEDALRESENRYRHIFQTVGVSIWEEDFSRLKVAIGDLKARGVHDFRAYLAEHPEFVREAVSMVRLVDVNDATLRLFAAASKDELLESLHTVFVPETERVFVEELIAIAEGGTFFEAETALRTLAGRHLTVLFTITFPPPAERFDSVLVTLTDITERKRAEERLRQQANLLEQTHDAIIVWEFPGTIQYWNRGAEQLYGFSMDEAIGRITHELLRTKHPMPAPQFEAMLARDRTWSGELTHTTRDGRTVVVDSRQLLVSEAEGRRLVLETNRDITEHVLAAEALREAQAELAHVTRVTMVGEITASIAHEVNQPLAAVVMNGNACRRWLAATPPNLDEARAALQRIVDDGNRASEVVRRIRSLLQRQTPERAALDVNDIVRESLALTRSELTRHRVAVRTDVRDDLPPILGDRVGLEQVLVNLILNAADAMDRVAESSRVLTLRSRGDDTEGVVVEVQDAGVGLDPEQIDRIFQPFVSTKPGGLGMGLAISRSIVEAHGGRLWVTRNEGAGVTMHAALPAEDGGRQ